MDKKDSWTIRSTLTVSLSAGLLYSVLEGTDYYLHFPLHSPFGLLELGLRNLILFLGVGIIAWVVTLPLKRLGVGSEKRGNLVQSLLLLFPTYFLLFHLLEGTGFIYRFLNSPKAVVLLLSGFMFIPLLVLFRHLSKNGGRRIPGCYLSIYFFITIGQRSVDWYALARREKSGLLTLIFISGVALALYLMGNWIVQSVRLRWPAKRKVGLLQALLLAAVVVGGVFLALFAPTGEDSAGPGSAAGHPNVLLIVLDTARADHFSCYGYGRDTTPFLRSFSRTATLYPTAISAAPWTLPSHASIFTGLYPSAHGATWKTRSLGARYLTLAEFLASKGYDTAGFSNNPVVNRADGLAQGFDLFVDMWKDDIANPTLFFRLDWFLRRLLGKNDGGAYRTSQWVREWLGHVYQEDHPFFLFVNLMECHLWHDAPDAYHQKFLESSPPAEVQAIRSNDLYYFLTGEKSLKKSEWMDYSAIYDGDLNYLDRMLEGLFGFLEKGGYLDDTIVVITADHGEHLGEHDMIDHQLSLYEPLLHVPLMIKLPETMTKLPEVRGAVQTVDIFPTLVDLLGLNDEDTMQRFQGMSLLRMKEEPHRVVISEYEPPLDRISWFLSRDPDGRSILKYKRSLKSVRIDSLKYVWSSNGDSELYNLARDPDEVENIINVSPEVAASLKERMTEWLQSFEHAAPNEAGNVKLDRATQQQLRALGYLN